QSQLERRLVRVLDRQPAVVTVSGIRVNAEPDLVDVERQRFLLITHVNADHFDTLIALAHVTSLGTSVSSESFVPSSSRRRFSETAIFRSGRWAAATKQAGTRPRSWPAARSRARIAPGLSPVTSRNVRPKVPRLPHPVWNAISVIESSVSRSIAVARSMRRVSK